VKVRNQAMHSPNLSLEDEYTAMSLDKMILFLETVKRGMKGKYDIKDCEDAIADIEQVS